MFLVLLSTLLIFSCSIAQETCPSQVSISLTRPESVTENGQATFTCGVTIASGSGYSLPSQATWQKEFVALDTSDTSRYRLSTQTVDSEARFILEILRTTVSDSGTYSCDPIIPGVICRESVQLTVNYALAAIVEDQDQVTGEDVRLECLVRGTDSRGVWYRYNETTATYIQLGGTDGKYTLSQNDSYFYLSFSSASIEDTGVYRCEAVSPSGRESTDFNFYALVPPSSTLIIGGTDGKFFGFTGNDLKLVCESQGIRAPQYNWTINGVVLEENTDKLEFNRTTGELTILAATRFDEGTYACVAYNKAGTKTVQVVVIIHIKATITSQVTSVNAGLDGVANLTCVLSASPPVDRVEWFKHPSSLGLANTTKHTYFFNGTLLVSNLQEDDDTMYLLKACNSISDIIHCIQSQQITLVVILKSPAPTDFSIISEDLTAYVVEIAWTNPSTVLRTAPTSYVLETRTSTTEEYIVLDEEIPVASSGGYRVIKLFPGYQNLFRIVGSNIAGLGAPSAQLNVTLPPGRPRIREVSVSIFTSSSLNVSYQLWHDGGKKLTQLVVEYKVNTSDNWIQLTDTFLYKNISYFLVIPDLNSLTYYDIRVAVSNSLGTSEFFQAEETIVPDSLPGPPTLEAAEIRLDSVIIRITLEDPGTGDLLGFFLLYYLNATLPDPVPIHITDNSLKVGATRNTWDLSIIGLESQKTYTISAAANSSIGVGPFSPEIEVYTETESFFESIYFKIFVAVLGFVLIIVVCLVCLLICIGCLCFRYGKKRGYFHIQKIGTCTGVENLALTEAEQIDSPLKSPVTSGAVPRGDSHSFSSTPPVIPPRIQNVLDESLDYLPSPPLPVYSTVKDPKHFHEPVDYRSELFTDFNQDKKNFLGQDRHPSQSLGNISQGSFITDV